MKGKIGRRGERRGGRGEEGRGGERGEGREGRKGGRGRGGRRGKTGRLEKLNCTATLVLVSYQDLINGRAALLQVDALYGHIVILLPTESLQHHTRGALTYGGRRGRGGAELNSMYAYLVAISSYSTLPSGVL